MEFIGYLGNILLALCGIPLVLEAIRNPQYKINKMFLGMWFLGEILVLVYVIGDPALMLNYITNVMCLTVIIILTVIRWRRNHAKLCKETRT